MAAPRNLTLAIIKMAGHPSIAAACHHARDATDDHRVVAVWEYDDRQAYERIDAAVGAGPATQRAHEQRTRLPTLFTAKELIPPRSKCRISHCPLTDWARSGV